MVPKSFPRNEKNGCTAVRRALCVIHGEKSSAAEQAGVSTSLDTNGLVSRFPVRIERRPRP